MGGEGSIFWSKMFFFFLIDDSNKSEGIFELLSFLDGGTIFARGGGGRVNFFINFFSISVDFLVKILLSYFLKI